MTETSEKNRLANERTDMAEDRTVMANERTFAGWMRTGLATMGIALGFNALFGRLQPEWVPRAIATGFLLVAILIFISGYQRASKVFNRLNTHSVERISRRGIFAVMITMVIGAVALIGAVWILRWE
ncbi:MAG: DUF202 domain-containing protein [Hellea sp.]|nr:DUF202 domain-containing protein [Hellea sp.]